MNSMFDNVLAPLEWVVAWLMVGFHQIFTAIGLPPASGLTWSLSIVGLVVVIRIILIPLFVKQIHASRGIQLIQPEMQKTQTKYKGKTDPESRQAMTQETWVCTSARVRKKRLWPTGPGDTKPGTTPPGAKPPGAGSTSSGT